MNSLFQEEGEWKEVGRRKPNGKGISISGDRKETATNFRCGLRESSFSVFVDHLPIFMDNFMLRSLFKECGKVVDAFIPRRPRKASKDVYGFVRFATKKEALGAIKVMNGRSVHGFPIFVGMERNLREVITKSVADKKERVGPLKEGFVNGRSFVNVVKIGREAEGSQKGEDVSAKVEGDDPISGSVKPSFSNSVGRKKVFLNKATFSYEDRSFIGKMHRSLKVKDIKDKVVSSVEGVMEVRFLGGPFVIIVFDNIDNIKDGITVIESFNLFESIVPWHNKFSNKYRVCWLRCVGIPISAWSIESLEKIGRLWGEVQDVDLSGWKCNGLEAGRVAVMLECARRVDDFIEVVVGGICFVVWVSEEPSWLEEDPKTPILTSKVNNIVVKEIPEVYLKIKRLEDSIKMITKGWQKPKKSLENLKKKVCKGKMHMNSSMSFVPSSLPSEGCNIEEGSSGAKNCDNGSLNGKRNSVMFKGYGTDINLKEKDNVDVSNCSSSDPIHSFEKDRCGIHLAHEVGDKTKVKESKKKKLCPILKSKLSLSKLSKNIGVKRGLGKSYSHGAGDRFSFDNCSSHSLSKISVKDPLPEALETIKMGKLVGMSIGVNENEVLDKVIKMVESEMESQGGGGVNEA